MILQTKQLTKDEVDSSILSDPFNTKGARNERNTPIICYNCGGFALKTFNWLTPYTDEVDDDNDPYTEVDREDFIDSLYEDGFDDNFVSYELVFEDTHHILKRFPFLEQIELEDARPEDTIIAYRVFTKWDESYDCVADTDFHFKVRLNGFWFEKMGGGEICLCDLNPDEKQAWIYNDDWAYISPIVYFRDKRADNARS